MYKTIRKKVAGSVSRLDFPEHYEWNKWLRGPDSDEYSIDSIPWSILDTNDINLWPQLPSTRGFTFDLPRIRISKAFKQISFKTQKGNKIFFSFPKLNLKEIKEILTEAEIDFSLSVSDSRKGTIFRISEGKNTRSSDASAEILIREFYLLTPGVLDYKMIVPAKKGYSINVSLDDEIKVFDLLSNLKTEVVNVEMLNSEIFSESLKFSENKEIKFHSLPDSSIVFKVEIERLEKLLDSINQQKGLVKKINFLRFAGIGAQLEVEIPHSVKNKLKILSVKNIKISLPKVKRGIKVTDKILSKSNKPSREEIQQKVITRTEDVLSEVTEEILKPEPNSVQEEITQAEDVLSKNTEEILQPELNSTQEEVTHTEDVLSKDIEEILQPKYNFTQEEWEDIYGFLKDYQKSAAEFVADKSIALLTDELGTGKTLEIIGALRILFKKNDVSDTIIVCRKEEAGWPKRNKVLSSQSLSGWYDHIQKYSPSTTVSIIYDNREEEWKNPSEIKILDHELFKEALEKKLVSMNKLNRKGCLILDEVEAFPEIALDALPKYLWGVSGLPADELKEKMSFITGSDEHPVIFGRTKEELADSLPARIRQDYWIEMDQDQKLEYEKALEAGREKIYDLVQAGNPFLVQSNVFTLIHQLTQIGNFYGKRESSAKSDLLLHHVRSIQKSGQKVLIYSQYDRQGTQKLEKLFAKNGIKYVLYQTGLSLKEMENAVKNFMRDKTITVFLAGMKAITTKMNLSNVSYLIHLDQWWSPATTWQAEERVSSSKNKLNIFNYFIKNSIDEKIQLKLIEKGLANKNLFDLLSSESMYSLITNEDWLEVLELIEPKDPESIEAEKKTYLDFLENLTTEDFSHKIKALLNRVGYKNVSFRTTVNPNEGRLYASGLKNSVETKAVALCLNMKIAPKKSVNDFADSLVTNIEKIFVFTTGEFEEKLLKNPGDDRIVLVNKYQTSEYFTMFNLI